MNRRFLISSVAAALTLMPLASEAAGEQKIAVFGDSLSDGLWMGLTQGHEAPDVHFVRLGHVSSGLVKQKIYDWDQASDEIARGPYAAAICMVGLNDQQTIETDQHAIPYGDPRWPDAYGDLVSDIAAKFADREMPLVWVGLPIVRDADLARGVRVINSILAERVPASHGLFIPTWDATSGPDHRYAEWLPDRTGHLANLRATDGVHMTGQGYVMLAHLVWTRMQADARFRLTAR